MLMVCSFFMLLIFTVGKEFQAGNNEVARAISSTYAMDSTDILSGAPLEPNAYWAETVFHFVS